MKSTKTGEIKGIRVICENGNASKMKVFNTETGREVAGITDIKMNCSTGNVVTLELKAFALGGFDISALPENVTIILSRGK